LPSPHLCTTEYRIANTSVRMFGQAIGPVLGGIIAQYLGFHGIFWVLFGGGAFALIILIVFLPETLHPIAGNGSLQLTGIHRPLYYKFSPFPSELIEHNLPPQPKVTPSMIFHPLKLLFHKDVFSVIFFGSIVYTVWSMMTSSTTALFQTRFGLDDLTLGLIFLPSGIASMMGAYVTGKLSKRDWRIMEQQYRAEKNIPGSVPLNKKHLADFPFEKARMRNIWWMVAIFIITTALYGFSLQFDILALPLILQFCVSFTANSIFTLNSTLVVDLFPGQAASATALNNLVRCLLGAGGVAVVQEVIDGIGGGWAFVLFAGITLLVCPLVVVEWKCGGKWASERRERLAAEKEVEGC
jgi:MFS family permease